jgi:PmbA protein
MAPSKPEPLLDFAEAALEAVRAVDASLAAEVYCYRGRDRGVQLRNGKLESIQESEEAGVGLRVFDGRRMAFAFSGGLEAAALPGLARSAREQLPHLESDEHRVLPEARESSEPAGLEESLNDPTLFTRPLAETIPELERVHRAASQRERIKKVLEVGYGETESEVAVASTAGVRTRESGTSAGIGLYTMGESDGEVQVGSSSLSERKAADIDWDRGVEEAVFRTTALLDAKKLPSKRRAVLFDPWVAGEVLDLVAGPMTAEAVQRGKSLFKGKLGTKIASDAVTLIDDPLLPGGITSGYYDDEGVPTSTKTMVERGVLKDFFYDTYTAKRDGRESNGCAGRTGFKGLPGPTSTNFFLKPGSMSRGELIRDTKDGILVFEIMGMHTADPISGEMSVGVAGVAIKDGEISHGIRGAMLSTNLLDLLSSVDAVADDLAFYGGTAAPTFRVADLTVA